MPMSKMEGRVTVPTGGWSMSLQEFTPNAGPTTVTVAAGDYYLTSTTSLLTAVKNALDGMAGGAGVYTVSLDDDADSSLGKVTISATGVTTFNITWSSTDLRDRLGFTANLSGAATYTGSEQAEYLFLPNVYRSNPMSPDGDQGAEESDFSITFSSSGASKRLAYNRRQVDNLEFTHLLGSKAFITWESTTNESLQKFWRDVIYPGYPFRYHKSRDTDATFVTWVALGGGEFKPKPVNPGWNNANSLWGWASEVRPLV